MVSGCEEVSVVFRAFYLAENVWQRLRDIYLGREKGWARSLYSSKLCLKAPGSAHSSLSVSPRVFRLTSADALGRRVDSSVGGLNHLPLFVLGMDGLEPWIQFTPLGAVTSGR